MNNLEEEYRKSQQEDTPDLWDRIEAELPPKKVKSKKIIYLARSLSAAAAVIVLVMLIPGILKITRGGTGSDFARDEIYDASPQLNLAEAGMAESQGSMDMEGAGEEGILSEQEEALQGDLAQKESMFDIWDMDVPGYYEESMQVLSSTGKSMDTVYTLQTLDGREITAVLSEGLEYELLSGETYVFTLQSVEASDWEYMIEEVK